MGSGSSRSLSPWKVAPCTLPILYCAEPVKPVYVGGESKRAYQTLCEDLELTLSVEVLLFKNTYKNRSARKWDSPFPGLTPQTYDSVPCSVGDILDRVQSVNQLKIGNHVFPSEANLFQISLQGKIQHREKGLNGANSELHRKRKQKRPQLPFRLCLLQR